MQMFPLKKHFAVRFFTWCCCGSSCPCLTEVLSPKAVSACAPVTLNKVAVMRTQHCSMMSLRSSYSRDVLYFNSIQYISLLSIDYMQLGQV